MSDGDEPEFRKPRVSPFDAPDTWSVLKGRYEGAPMMIRIRTGVEPAVGHPDFGVQIGIAVPFNVPQEDGLPTPEEGAQLDAIEDRLQQELETTRRAALVAVITTGAMREFVFYAQSADWVRAWAGAFIDSVDSHEIQVMSRPDQDWSVYRELLGE
jgi:hypothetical protein